MRKTEPCNVATLWRLASSAVRCRGRRDAVQDARELAVAQESPLGTEGRVFS